ncbi:MAG: hypothetical protein JWQ99_2854 [Blastococcus sp.]|nr:hypothetical protein [Blastococcus sp.]
MQRIRLLVVLLLAVAMSLTGLGSASAGTDGYPTQAPQIKSVYGYATVDSNDREVARVRGTYKCFGGQPIHLWVSVKQGGPDPTAPGSSATVKAWYDTNASHDVYVNCDGQWHTRTVRLGREATDFGGRPLGHLKNGRAWLQFCLVAGEDESLLASESRWVTVRGAGYYGPA